jgi:hypothetical protein
MGFVLTAFSLYDARTGAAQTQRSGLDKWACAGAAERLMEPPPADKTPQPTRGALIVEGSLVLYVCDFMSLSRVTFFPFDP